MIREQNEVLRRTFVGGNTVDKHLTSRPRDGFHTVSTADKDTMIERRKQQMTATKRLCEGGDVLITHARNGINGPLLHTNGQQIVLNSEQDALLSGLDSHRCDACLGLTEHLRVGKELIDKIAFTRRKPTKLVVGVVIKEVIPHYSHLNGLFILLEIIHFLSHRVALLLAEKLMPIVQIERCSLVRACCYDGIIGIEHSQMVWNVPYGILCEHHGETCSVVGNDDVVCT